jgi:2-polyprenyl-3-methyl-5-hydroxy-6-metoxy-1,4-benzoquinol methylase
MNREHKRNAYNQFLKNLKKLKIINSNLKIIDIGCGTAGFGEYCLQRSIQYSGFDASHAQVEFAIKAGIDVTCATSIKDYLMTCNIDTNAQVVFTLWDVLEHIRNPTNLLKELKAVPVKTKYLFISVPNGGALRWKRAIHNIVKGRFSYDAWEHVFYFTPKSLSMAMDNIGFKTLKIGSVVCYPRSLNLAELIRRFSFVFFRYDAARAPQIYLFAKVL